MPMKNDKTKMLSRLMNAKQFATLVGVAARTVTNWADDGMPCTRAGRSGAPVSIDLRRALKWVIKRRVERETPARVGVAQEQAERLRIQNRRARGELIEANLVEETIKAAIAGLMQDWVALAQRVTTDEALQGAIVTECRGAQARFAKALGDLSETFKSRAAETATDGQRVGG